MPNKYLDETGLAEYTSLVKAELATKAPLASPALTGTPTAPTPTAGDDSTKIATTAYVQDEIDAEVTRADGAYLPLTGGSVTGNLSVSGTITGNVTGSVTGTASGNLPLSGGTMTGNITFNKTNPTFVGALTTGNIAIYAGSNNFDGATLQMFGRSDSTYAGMFYLRASTKSSGSDSGGVNYDLVGRNDGRLTWAGNNVITAAGGTYTTALPVARNVNSSYTQINGGVATNDGANLMLFGKDESRAGAFRLNANDGSASKTLQGDTNGTLTWGGSYVAVTTTLQNGRGILTGTKDSITVSANGYATGTISFGQAFASAPKVVANCAYGHAHVYVGCYNITTTGFTYIVSSENATSFTNERINWVAVL